MIFVVFGEDPWRSLVDVFVGAADQRKDTGEGAWEVELVKLKSDLCPEGYSHLDEIIINDFFLFRCWHDTITVFVDH